MLHNSILIRDLLQEKNHDPINLQRRDPHQNVVSFKNGSPTINNILFHDSWKIVSPLELLPFDSKSIELLLDDMANFLDKLGVTVTSTANNQISLILNQTISTKTILFCLQPNMIQISAPNLSLLWQGWIYLEKELINHQGGFSRMGTFSIQPQWPIQISQSPRGANYLVPDLSSEYLTNDAFRLLIHYGINGMIIYGDLLFYIQNAILPELNNPSYSSYTSNIQMLRDATERAAHFGVSLYYVPVLPKLRADHPVFINHPEVRGSKLRQGSSKEPLYCLCSSNSTSLQFFQETMHNLFTQVPLLGGLILIIGGESYYHCYMNPELKKIAKIGKSNGKTNCHSCGQSTAEKTVNNFIHNTAIAVHQVSPNAIIMAWPYSAQRWSVDGDQTDFLKNFPPEIALLSEIDKDQSLKKDGYTKSIWDYSIDFVGPSDRIKHQAEIIHNKSNRLFLKTETALGLELINVPYIPCLFRLLEKWENVRTLNPSGVIQSWMFFGMWGSRAEELGWWQNWHPELSKETIFQLMAQRDFGDHSEIFIRAWDKMSQAIGHLPAIPPYFIGPMFLGPAHPLIVDKKMKLSPVFFGALYYKQENEESFSTSRLQILDSLILDRLPKSPKAWGFRAQDSKHEWQLFITESELATQFAFEAWNFVNKTMEKNSDSFRLTSNFDSAGVKSVFEINRQEEFFLMEFIYRTLLCMVNTIRFLYIRDHPKKQHAELQRIAELECQNAEASIRIYQACPWLDLAQRMDGRFPSSLAILEEKIRILNLFLLKK